MVLLLVFCSRHPPRRDQHQHQTAITALCTTLYGVSGSPLSKHLCNCAAGTLIQLKSDSRSRQVLVVQA